jgi:hypothetical protein
MEDALCARVDLVTTSGVKPRSRPVVERDAIDVALGDVTTLPQ